MPVVNVPVSVEVAEAPTDKGLRSWSAIFHLGGQFHGGVFDHEPRHDELTTLVNQIANAQPDAQVDAQVAGNKASAVASMSNLAAAFTQPPQEQEPAAHVDSQTE